MALAMKSQRRALLPSRLELMNHVAFIIRVVLIRGYPCVFLFYSGDGAAVLLRALDPKQGMDLMRKRRGAKRSDGGAKLKDKELCNGPSKLTEAMSINKANSNKLDMLTSNELWLEDGEEINKTNIVISTRIGIDSYGKEWAEKPWRFYVLGNVNVSKKDKKAEAELKTA